MKIIDPDNQVQKDALLNEYKGNLFEYLVALYLSKELKLESFFYENLNESLKDRLVLYEEFIRNHYYDLIDKLALLASQTVRTIKKYLTEKDFQVLEIHLIGKNVATNDNSLWGETDLVLVGLHQNQKVQLKISIKLSRDASYTNTKSAGVKSFLEKYFKSFASSKFDQIEFNNKVDFYFQNFGAKLYSHEGLVFEGQFDSKWFDQYPSLPGELNEEQQVILFEYYSLKASLLHEYIQKYFNSDKKLFMKSLLPLVGQFSSEIIQIITYHKDHHWVDTQILENDWGELDLLGINYKMGSHYIDIRFKNKILQLRIKPMNKFTTQSYKVNCSVKELSNAND